MRNMNKSTRKWTPAALACALAMMAMLAAAPAWAYTATVKNKTEHTVKVVVFEMRFPGVNKSVGAKFLKPGETAQFKSNGAYCFDHYEGWFYSNLQVGPDTVPVVDQHWYLKAAEEMACCDTEVRVKQRSNGNFYFQKR